MVAIIPLVNVHRELNRSKHSTDLDIVPTAIHQEGGSSPVAVTQVRPVVTLSLSVSPSTISRADVLKEIEDLKQQQEIEELRRL